MKGGVGVLEWRVDELKELDRKNRKLLTLHKRLHPQSDVDRLYVSRKEEKKRTDELWKYSWSEESNLGCHLKSSKENLVQGVKYVEILKFKESVSKKDFDKSLNEKRVKNWKAKQMYRHFIRDMPGGTDKENSGSRLKMWFKNTNWNSDWYTLHKNKQ